MWLYICKEKINYVLIMAKKKKRNIQSLSVSDISKMLIVNCPNAIVLNSDDELDFEETVYNFAVYVCDGKSGFKQDETFGRVFQDYDDAYDYLINHINTLRYDLEDFIMSDKFKK